MISMISELLEDIFEFQLIWKKSDHVQGGFYHLESFENTYDQKGNITRQTSLVQIYNKENKLIDEASSDTEYELDKHGNIIKSKVYGQILGSSNTNNMVQNYQVILDKQNRISAKYVDMPLVVNEKTIIPVSMQAKFIYDEFGNFKVVTFDKLPKGYDESMNGVMDLFTSDIYLFEYDDMNQLIAIDLIHTYRDWHNSDYIVSRFVVEYSEGRISKIHNVSDPNGYMDEVFEYYNDETVTVTKNDYGDDLNTVLGKCELLFKIIK